MRDIRAPLPLRPCLWGCWLALERCCIRSQPGGKIVAMAGLTLLALVFVATAAIKAYASEPETRAMAKYASTAILDGRRYRAHTLGKDGKREGDDVLVFQAGNFSSSSCGQYGFGEGLYWIRTQGDTIHFLAETTSPTHGTILWKGSVQGDRLEASYVWTKVRWYWTIQREYRMIGTREQ